jgi:PAS domain S-box-containing protein
MTIESLIKQTEVLKNTVDALRKSEEQYHRMVGEVQDYAIILLSRDGTIETWNKGAEKIKGYTRQEAQGKNFRIFYTPEDRARSLPEALIQEAVTNGKANHEGWRLRKDGSQFWGSISITALHDNQQNVIGFSKVTRDLTERRAHELRIEQLNEDLMLKNRLLGESEELYHRMVLEVDEYAIILLSLEGNIQNWNNGAQKIKGYAADEIIGKHFSVFYLEEDRGKGLPEKLLGEALANGKAVHEGWRLKKDGSKFWGTVVITALHNHGGTITGFTKVTRDLTEKKLAEEKFLAAKKMEMEQKNREVERVNEELSSFAHISGHDLQEPLRKIQVFSDRILEIEYEKLSEKGKRYLTRMEAGALRMQNLIHDILEYTRITTSKKELEPTNLNELLSHSKQKLERMIREKTAIIESDQLPILKVIRFQIQQLFDNLLHNALKFAKDHVPPHLVIRSDIIDGKVLQSPSPVAAERYCHISFQDNGIGFDAMYEKKIFELFQRLHSRTEYPGAGIGLAVCKKIAENHNGTVTAESFPNKGATFHVYLPVVEV